AGVSALGFGGTNAHIILEEAPEPADPPPARPWQLLTLSAKTPAALEQTARNLAEHLRAYPDANLADVAYTLQVGRRAFAHRRALVVRDSADALAALQGDAPLGAQGTSEALERPLALALAELDEATLRRAHALYGREPVYRERFERCAALLEAHLGLDLRSLLPEGAPEAADLPPAVSIPAGVAVAYALAQQWQVWGMRPSVVLGGGAGEYAAACLAGVLDLGDALALAAAHARTSGPEASQAREEYAALLKRIQFQAPQIEYLPALPDADPRDPRVWLRLLDSPAALPRLDALAGRTGLLALGCGLAGELDMLPPADGSALGWEGVLLALARLWVAGVPVDWRGYHAPERRRRVPLPTYPFERQRFWVDFNAVEGSRQRPAGPAGWLYSPTWRRDQPPAPQPDAWSTPAHWLVCLDSSGLGAALAERLRQQGQRVTVVQSGAAFARLDEQTLEINPLRAGDYAALLADLAARQSLPAQVIHCWSLDAQPPEPDAPAWTPSEPGLSSLLLLAQSLGGQRLRGPVQLWVITERLFDITGEEAAAPGQAALLGLSQALAAELPSLVCRTLDIARSPRAPQQALDQIMAELAAAPPERLITYRSRHRWLPVVAALTPERSGTPPVAPAGAACLLAGPLTPAMEQTALVLGRFGWQRLALALPQPLPARQEWQRWLDTDATDPEAADLASAVLCGALPLGDTREIQALLDSRSAAAAAAQAPAQQAEELELDADKLCASYVCAYLSRHGIGTVVGQRYRRDALLAQLRIMPKYQRLFDFMLSILVDEGIVAQEGDSITVIWPLQSQPAPEQLRDEFNGRYPDAAAGFAALEHCVRHYDEVLTGALDPIAVLYPQGSSELMQAITDNQARFSNLTACREQIAQLAAELARRQPGRPLRILEIGAGEGNLTWPVAAALHGLPVTMHVSDIGKSFVIAAERRAEALGYDWMSFGVLDIARDPAEQGYRPFDYDLILASEVFHATRDVRASVGHAGELLAPGGLLCLVEATRAQRWSTMIWGMLDGWWHFEDTELRSDSPLLPAEGWREVGQQCGLTPLGTRAGVVDGDYSLLALQQPDAPASPRFAPWRAALLRERQGHMRRTLAAIQRLEQAGLGLLVLDGDPLTPTAAGQLLAQAEAQAGPLRGVVVALDGADNEPAGLSAASRGAFERAVARRLARLLALEPHLGGRTLDLALLLGTLAAFAPSPGAAAEAAAQQTAAALAAQSHAGDGPRWTCLHLDDQATGQALEHALEQALAARQPQLLVAPRDLERASQDWWRVARPAEGPTAPGLPVRHTRPNLPTAYVAPRDEAEQQIEQIWQEVLGMSQLGIHDSFLDLGGDSLQATQLLSRLRDTFGQEIPLRTFFETPTIAGLAQALARLRAEQEQRDMLDVLAMIQQLSPEQLAQELQRRRQASAEPPVGAP
ncbi:MAG TPA: phosphopantetheine-binding protein, partial [Roseiflexaceae bacterium]|nr:phosphopantetheine-binding protein [Roseiflexaceae bacterium]